jgi:hypothetical protein
MKRFIVIGLDFGTTYTKCVFRDDVNGVSWPVSFHLNGKNTYFVDSFVNLQATPGEGGAIKSPFQGNLQRDIQGNQGTRRYLKVRLLRAVIESPQDTVLLYDAKLNAGLYLSHVLFHVMDKVNVWASARRIGFADLNLLVQMCMPDRHSDQQKMGSTPRDVFRSVLSVAYAAALSRYNEFIASGHVPGSPLDFAPLPSVDDIRSRMDVPIAADRSCRCVSETYAISQTVLMNRSVPSGFFFIVDVGGGTVDVSLVHVQRNSSRPFVIYENEVIFQGSSVFDVKLKARFPGLSFKQVINLKEGRRAGLPASFDLNAFESEWEIVSKQVYKDTATNLGTVIWRSLHYWGSLYLMGPDGKMERNPRLWPAVKGSDFKDFQYIFLGNGYVKNPYEEACRHFYRTMGWDVKPNTLQLMPPSDFKGLDHASLGFTKPTQVLSDPFVMRRFAVAYGLSFEADGSANRPIPCVSPAADPLTRSDPSSDYIDT